MSRPRTPEHFPRMKVRGGRRRHLQRATQRATLARRAARLDWATIGRAILDGFAALTEGAGAALLLMGEALRQEPRRDDHALAGPGERA